MRDYQFCMSVMAIGLAVHLVACVTEDVMQIEHDAEIEAYRYNQLLIYNNPEPSAIIVMANGQAFTTDVMRVDQQGVTLDLRSKIIRDNHMKVVSWNDIIGLPQWLYDLRRSDILAMSTNCSSLFAKGNSIESELLANVVTSNKQYLTEVEYSQFVKAWNRMVQAETKERLTVWMTNAIHCLQRTNMLAATHSYNTVISNSWCLSASEVSLFKQQWQSEKNEYERKLEIKNRQLKVLEDQRKEKELAFQQEQIAKGLVYYQNKWMTPIEQKELEIRAQEMAHELAIRERAEKLVNAKRKDNAQFRVIQALDKGSLCILIGSNGNNGMDNEVFYWIDLGKKAVADDELYRGVTLYWAGTYTYTTVKKDKTTVNAYSGDKDAALAVVREKFGLEDNPQAQLLPPVDGPPTFDREKPIGFGSGFLVSSNGYILSNYHVVRGSRKVQVISSSTSYNAQIVDVDRVNDIALLKIDGAHRYVEIGQDTAVKKGQTVFTLGFPSPDIQGYSPKVTKGVLSGLRGAHDDIRYFQIDAAVQPGNSGGPLADESGAIIGIVSASLNAVRILEKTGSLPQNVNYALKLSYIKAFLENSSTFSACLQNADTSHQRSFEDSVSAVECATVLVVSY